MDGRKCQTIMTVAIRKKHTLSLEASILALSPNRPSTPLSTLPGKSMLREFGETMIGAVVLATIIVLFVARAFTVDGPSMLPTLQTGERLLIDKITYRLREPHRGDVIVFRYPSDPRQYYIKRVVGLPGDEVKISSGTLYVNGLAIHEEYINGPILGTYGPHTVSEGHYFVLGDNRNNSEDSRSQRVGEIPRHLIVGRALMRYWPLPRSGLIDSEPVVWASP